MTIQNNPFNKINTNTQEPQQLEEIMPVESQPEALFAPPSIQNETQGIQMQTQGIQLQTPQNKQAPKNVEFGFASTNNSTPVSSTKYNIIDLFWMINFKIYTNNPLSNGEVHILTLGFNADYLNLRVGFRVAENNAFSQNAINIQNTKLVSTINLFPETCQMVKSFKKSGTTIPVFERVFKSDSWTPNSSNITWNKDDTISIICTDNRNNSHSFVIQNFQIQMFESALDFMTNGNAFNLAMNAIFKR